MVKKIRVRRDQYYHLARESGYRSRAAFKLLQLDNKMGFLSSARCVVDLCAAPGGWLQAAAERMPPSSLIIGVDLVPIRSIKGTITLQGDITTQECRAAVIREMTGWLADAVLHDGSPNIGGNWTREAFDQNCLVLSALKLASSVLKKGGAFVTKVFRSQDYTALLGVFRKLFSKVQATKPAASRSESAEIFVVCQNFQPVKGEEAADLFDPQIVFAATSSAPSGCVPIVKNNEAAAAAVLKERKRKLKSREGYDETAAGNLAYSGLSALAFVKCTDGTHAKMIAESGSIILDDSRLAEHPLTTAEIKECCRDVRVLGRRELRLLLAWRRKMAKMLSKEGKKDVDDEPVVNQETEAVVDEDEEEGRRTDLQIQSLKDAERRRTKKKLKKERETKIASRKRMTAAPDAAKFRSVHDLLLEEGGGQNELFSLRQLRSAADLEATVDTEAPEVGANEDEKMDDESDDEYHSKGRRKTVAYRRDEDCEYDDDELLRNAPDEVDAEKERKALRKAAKERKRKKRSKEDVASDEDEDNVDNAAVGECPLAVSCEPTSERDKRFMKHWEDTVSNLINSKKGEKRRRKRNESSSDSSDDDSNDGDLGNNELADWELEALARIKCKSTAKDDTSEKQVVKAKKKKKNYGDGSSSDDDLNLEPKVDDSDDDDIKPGKTDGGKLDPVSLALGAKLISSRRARRELIESGYNRFSFGAAEATALPGWFVEDEKQHSQPNLPVSHRDVQFYRDRLKALNTRPIHKVAEARARKKRRMMGKIETARKEAERLADNEQMTDAERQAALKRVYRSARSASRQENRVQLVISRGKATGKRVMRPPGVKGRYKVVDSRMKKDLRAQKNAAKGRRGKKRR